jgi:hypothetical protein
MGVRFREGFSFTDLTNGQSSTFSVSLPPPKATTTYESRPTNVNGAVVTSAPGPNARSSASYLKRNVFLSGILVLLGI